MNKSTLSLVSAIALIGLTLYWFVSQKIQSLPQNAAPIINGQTNEPTDSSYRNLMNPASTSPTLTTSGTIKAGGVDVGEEADKAKINATFSISNPETENTMRITPSKNNSTMDVKK